MTAEEVTRILGLEAGEFATGLSTMKTYPNSDACVVFRKGRVVTWYSKW